MVKITPDPPPTSKSPLSKAAQQALDKHCLDPSSSLAHALFEVRHSITTEEALITASEVLDCANATAYEAADGLCGAQRKHALAVVHLVSMAQALVDCALARREQR